MSHRFIYTYWAFKVKVIKEVCDDDDAESRHETQTKR